MTRAVAGLAMYAHPALAASNDAFWALIRDDLRAKGVKAPIGLDPVGVGDTFWKRPDLVLGHTCSYPYRTRLADHVHLVGTLDYGVEGCVPGYYRSAIITRTGSDFSEGANLDRARVVINAEDSQSGFVALKEFLDGQGIRLKVGAKSGSHIRSVVMVASGAADLAAIDAVTWRILCENEPVAEELDVIAETRPTPGLPLICARQFDPDIIAAAVAAAITALSKTDRERLGVRQLVRLGRDVYLC